MIIFILIFHDALYPHTEGSHQAKEALPMKVILRPSDRPNSPWLMRQWQRLRLAVRALVQNLRMVSAPNNTASRAATGATNATNATQTEVQSTGHRQMSCTSRRSNS